MKHSSWIVNPSPHPEASVRLVCLPYAGGSAAVYRPWLRAFPSQVEVVAIQLPGRGGRFKESLYDQADELVNALFRDCQHYFAEKPLVLFGHSMGAMLAYELALKLEQCLPGMLRHLIVSAFRGEQRPPTPKVRHLLSDLELREELKHLNGTPPELLHNKELMELFVPIIRADMKMCDTYRFDERVLHTGITAFGGVQDTEVSEAELEAWSKRTEGAYELKMYPGDHFFFQQDEQSFLHELNQIVERLALTSGVEDQV